MVYPCKKPTPWQRDSSVESDAINNIMTDAPNTTPSNQPQQPEARPNENTGLNIDEHVKIWDPNTKAVILEKRA